jgi:GNAT superfamily N-acetyltransferase
MTHSAPEVDAIYEATRGDYTVSDDIERLDRALIHSYLAHDSYWARGVPKPVVDRSIDHSLNFGLYDREHQIGYARVITDRATFGFLRDVFVVEPARGLGLGSWLVEVLLAHPDLQGLRRVMLATRDAHGLYQRFGFAPLRRPDRFLSIEHPSKELYR